MATLSIIRIPFVRCYCCTIHFEIDSIKCAFTHKHNLTFVINIDKIKASNIFTLNFKTTKHKSAKFNFRINNNNNNKISTVNSQYTKICARVFHSLIVEHFSENCIRCVLILTHAFANYNCLLLFTLGL